MFYKYPGEKILEPIELELPETPKDLKDVKEAGWREGYYSAYIERETSEIMFQPVECPYTDPSEVKAFWESVWEGQQSATLELDLYL